MGTFLASAQEKPSSLQYYIFLVYIILYFVIIIYYINREQSHRTEIQIIHAQTRMTNDKHSK